MTYHLIHYGINGCCIKETSSDLNYLINLQDRGIPVQTVEGFNGLPGCMKDLETEDEVEIDSDFMFIAPAPLLGNDAELFFEELVSRYPHPNLLRAELSNEYLLLS